MKELKRDVSALAVLALMVLLAGSLYGQAGKQASAVAVAEIDYGELMVDDSAPEHTSTDQVGYTCSTTQEAGEMLREGMKNRKKTIVINFTGSFSDVDATSLKIYNIALAHTGVSDEGDYLNWSHTKTARQYSSAARRFTYVVTYLDDAKKEKETTAAIKKLESKLAIKSSDSTYKKIYTIYDYLAKHITYDYKDTSNLPYTSYDAIVNGKAVCQGYATLFYRMLLDYGIDNRIVVSNNHAWNIVNVDGKYYECDLTWDSQGVQRGSKYQYLLKAKLTGSEHKWRTAVLDDAVTKLPRASSDYDASKAKENVSETKEKAQTEATKETAKETEKEIETETESVTESETEESTEEALEAPTLKATKKSKSAVLKWSEVEGADGYRIFRKVGNGSWKKIATVTDKMTYTDKGLKKGTYKYRVHAYNGTQKGSYSKAKKIVIK
jgi:hypothetical protein